MINDFNSNNDIDTRVSTPDALCITSEGVFVSTIEIPEGIKKIAKSSIKHGLQEILFKKAHKKLQTSPLLI